MFLNGRSQNGKNQSYYCVFANYFSHCPARCCLRPLAWWWWVDFRLWSRIDNRVFVHSKTCLRRPTAGFPSGLCSHASSPGRSSIRIFEQCKHPGTSAQHAANVPGVEIDRQASGRSLGLLLWEMAASSGGKMGLGRSAV